MPRLEPGDPAPEFTLTNADGSQVSLSHYRGRHVIVFFYPAAMTRGCTAQARDFQDHLTDLGNAGYAVLGISPDTPDALRESTERDQLTFPLLSDPDHQVLQTWGAWGQRTKNGEPTTGVIRSTIVVKPDGTVHLAWYDASAYDHVTALRAQLHPQATMRSCHQPGTRQLASDPKTPR
jgi:peroxiredoxin Q/BCP